MDNKRVLMVKLNRLGDMVAFFPTIEILRKKWPKAHLTLLTTDVGREVVHDSKLLNSIWTSTINEIKTIRGFLRWLKIVRKNRFDVAIASSDSSSFVALLFFISAIPTRIGFSNPKLSFLFNVKIPFSKNLSHLELNLLIPRRLGCPINYQRPRIDIPKKDNDTTLQILKEYGIKESDKFIVLHPGSNRFSRRWSSDRFAELIKCLFKQYSIKIICIGAEKEKELALLLVGRFCRDNNFIDLTGRTSVKQLVYLISLASLFIGHSSGPLQIAYLVATPSISLWGASSLEIWGPVWNKEKHICIQPNLVCCGCEQAKCPKGTLECMSLITVNMVVKEVSKLLDKDIPPQL